MRARKTVWRGWVARVAAWAGCLLVGWAARASAQGVGGGRVRNGHHGRDGSVLYVDRMDPLHGHDTGSLFSPLCESPSRLIAVREPCGYDPRGGVAFGLRLVALIEPSQEKPDEQSGWCAYCMTVKRQGEYLNADLFQYLTFYVRGEVGGEKLAVALVDKDHEGDLSGMAGLPVASYLPDGVIHKQWQQARIPLHDFRVNRAALSKVLFIFDNRMYESATLRRILLYVDELALE